MNGDLNCAGGEVESKWMRGKYRLAEIRRRRGRPLFLTVRTRESSVLCRTLSINPPWTASFISARTVSICEAERDTSPSAHQRSKMNHVTKEHTHQPMTLSTPSADQFQEGIRDESESDAMIGGVIANSMRTLEAPKIFRGGEDGALEEDDVGKSHHGGRATDELTADTGLIFPELEEPFEHFLLQTPVLNSCESILSVRIPGVKCFSRSCALH